MWQLMSSAPRDATRIIGWFGDRCVVVFWRSGPELIKRPGCRPRQTSNIVFYWSDGYTRFPEPHYWQPCPDAPHDGRRWCELCDCRISVEEAATCRSRNCSLKVAA
jgi:hypothetical protein